MTTVLCPKILENLRSLHDYEEHSLQAIVQKIADICNEITVRKTKTMVISETGNVYLAVSQLITLH